MGPRRSCGQVGSRGASLRAGEVVVGQAQPEELSSTNPWLLDRNVVDFANTLPLSYMVRCRLDMCRLKLDRNKSINGIDNGDDE